MRNHLRKHALALLAALLLTYFISLSLQMNDYYRAYFPDTIQGRAYRPFAYRALYPSLIRTTSNALPGGVKASLTAFGEHNPLVKKFILRNKIPASYVPEYLLFIGLTIASFYGFFLILNALIVHFYPTISPESANLWMFFALIPVFLMTSVYFYVYDPGLWFTFYLAFWLMIRRQWWPFLLAFFLCTFNKESSLLLIPLLYFWTKAEDPKKRTFLLLASSAIWVMTFSVLRYIYASNRGSFLEFHLFDQWLGAKNLDFFASFLCTVPWLFFLCIQDWKEKPLILRQGLLWTFIPLFLLMLVFGYILEMRDYYESFVFAYLLAIPSMQVMWQRLRKNRDRTPHEAFSSA